MENLGQAVLAMVLGMGGVYVFLTVQAFITVLLTRLAPADGLPAPAEAIVSHPVAAPLARVSAARAPSPAAGVPAVAVPTATLAPAVSVAVSNGPTVAIIQAAIAAYESDQGVR